MEPMCVKQCIHNVILCTSIFTVHSTIHFVQQLGLNLRLQRQQCYNSNLREYVSLFCFISVSALSVQLEHIIIVVHTYGTCIQ